MNKEELNNNNNKVNNEEIDNVNKDDDEYSMVYEMIFERFPDSLRNTKYSRIDYFGFCDEDEEEDHANTLIIVCNQKPSCDSEFMNELDDLLSKAIYPNRMILMYKSGNSIGRAVSIPVPKNRNHNAIKNMLMISLIEIDPKDPFFKKDKLERKIKPLVDILMKNGGISLYEGDWYDVAENITEYEDAIGCLYEAICRDDILYCFKALMYATCLENGKTHLGRVTAVFDIDKLYEMKEKGKKERLINSCYSILYYSLFNEHGFDGLKIKY